MKLTLTSTFILLAAALTVGAAPIPNMRPSMRETNAARMAHGLPPLAPANLKRTPVDSKPPSSPFLAIQRASN